MDSKKVIREIGTQVSTMLAMGYRFNWQVFKNIFLLFGHESGYQLQIYRFESSYVYL
jgi:hypothetical protein